VAPDQDKLRDLQTEVKRFIAWKSILSDKDDLNLDGGQLREAESSLNRSNSSVETRMKETYCWLLVPFIDQYEDIKTIQWEISNLGGGDDEIVSKATKKMIQDRKSTRLNSSHVSISYAVFCLKKKKEKTATLE